jgi:predicted nuclease with TOPRIM domain
VAESEVKSLKSSLQERESQLKDVHFYKENYPKLKQQYENCLRQLQQVKPHQEEAEKMIKTQDKWVNDSRGYIDALEDNADQLDENCVAVLQEVINRDNDVERLKERLRELGDDPESFVPSDSLVPIENMGAPHYKVIRTNVVRKRSSDWAKWIVSRVSKNGPIQQAGSDAINLFAGKPPDEQKTSSENTARENEDLRSQIFSLEQKIALLEKRPACTDPEHQELKEQVKTLKQNNDIMAEMIDTLQERALSKA